MPIERVTLGKHGAAEVPDRCARERLLRAAAEIFSRKGYSATSVGEIVAAAGVTKPVLYYHFKNKEGLYLKLLEEALGKVRPVVEAALQVDGRTAEDRIRGLCMAIIDHALQNLDIVRLTRGLHHAPPQGAPEFDAWEFPLTVKSALERLVEAGMRAKEFSGVSHRDLVWTILGLINVCVDSNLIGRPKIALGPRGFRSALDHVLRGATSAGPTRQGDR